MTSSDAARSISLARLNTATSADPTSMRTHNSMLSCNMIMCSISARTSSVLIAHHAATDYAVVDLVVLLLARYEITAETSA